MLEKAPSPTPSPPRNPVIRILSNQSNLELPGILLINRSWAPRDDSPDDNTRLTDFFADRVIVDIISLAHVILIEAPMQGIEFDMSPNSGLLFTNGLLSELIAVNSYRRYCRGLVSQVDEGRFFH